MVVGDSILRTAEKIITRIRNRLSGKRETAGTGSSVTNNENATLDTAGDVCSSPRGAQFG